MNLKLPSCYGFLYLACKNSPGGTKNEWFPPTPPVDVLGVLSQEPGFILPGLVTVGQRDGRNLLLNLESFGTLDLVGPHERLVDPPDHRRDAVDRVQALVRVHLSGDVGIGSNLPSAQVNRL